LELAGVSPRVDYANTARSEAFGLQRASNE
jgi:hypothetical protein